MIEQGQRRPSVTVAEVLIRTYELAEDQADTVRSVALADVGRSSPFRSTERTST